MDYDYDLQDAYDSRYEHLDEPDPRDYCEHGRYMGNWGTYCPDCAGE